MRSTATIVVALLFVLSTAMRALPAATTFEFELQAESKPEPKDPGASKSETFKPDQIEQIVAPIALHPDPLLAQILMASTYPLEIVQAFRWLQKNPDLKGPALEEALKKNDWDPSVKALCGLRDVVKQMNDNIDWTKDLGDAFLAQKEELMQAVQRMRKKAFDAGNLKTTEQLKVSQDDTVIVIESAKPEVVYVPSYSPVVVYGGWSYPSYYYPPMYVAPPPAYGFMAFTAGVIWGAAIWGGCNWRGNDVNINVNNFNNFNRNTNINPNRNNLAGAGGGNAQWKHNADHRQGVNYKSPKTAQQFGGTSGANRAAARDQARGYDRSAGQSPANRAGGSAGAGNRATPAARTPAAAPKAAAPRASTGSSALSGSRSPGAARSQSTRGATSRSGGGARGGGGGRGGGGRR